MRFEAKNLSFYGNNLYVLDTAATLIILYDYLKTNQYICCLIFLCKIVVSQCVKRA